MKTSSVLFWLLLSSLGFAGDRPHIQIALLLDTSGSMDGLIDQARASLWHIVNDLASAKKDGRRPDLEVALYEYGKSSIPAERDYLNMLVPLTTDLDRVSEALFALRTNGGEEYCGAVIRAATNGLSWSESKGDYKAIFIAGNEPFNQGGIDFRNACTRAIGKGIVVNTIFCGPELEGVQGFWKEGADLADGSFSIINQDQRIAHVAAPQDDRILALNQKLNTTYVAYGPGGEKAKLRQEKQDSNAGAMADEVLVQRALTKSTAAYKTESWDLVAAAEAGEVDVTALAPAQLPEPMKAMTAEEKKAYVAKQAKERTAIKEELSRLSKDRETFLAGRQPDKTTLDAVLSEAVRTQLRARSFEF